MFYFSDVTNMKFDKLSFSWFIWSWRSYFSLRLFLANSSWDCCVLMIKFFIWSLLLSIWPWSCCRSFYESSVIKFSLLSNYLVISSWTMSNLGLKTSIVTLSWLIFCKLSSECLVNFLWSSCNFWYLVLNCFISKVDCLSFLERSVFYFISSMLSMMVSNSMDRFSIKSCISSFSFLIFLNLSYKSLV